ncbi:PEBP-like protein [Neolentinus lepideus HHB14362 ss-1]|uniref:PEBP-like protein n=1 Tax=Neolentinus lepideus HHB14362 ss-1 TaxID=1314782 RepID=A0A165S5J1_9AGAM|nr:PEBP-like protein [Neolentinus lepideus HHB14362 ss-1]
MLTLRRARASLNALRRGNATVAADAAPAISTSPPPPAPSSDSSSQSAAPPAPGAAEGKGRTKGRNRPLQTRRAFITLDRPREWNRPLAPGVLPAYDEALRLIRRDAAEIQREAGELERELSEKEVGEGERRAMEEKLGVLRVQGEVNLPEVRWRARNGMGEWFPLLFFSLSDLQQPVYRHLVEQRWRGEGALDLLMERIHQMHVVPDVLPDLHPSFDVRVTFPDLPSEDKTKKSKVKHHAVEPGVFLSPKQTRRPPRIYTTVFHTDPRYYTMILVDADYPDAENRTFKTYLHWMQPNVQLSASSTGPFTFRDSHTPYIPPHPQKGSPYHRYVLLLLPHPNPTETLNIPAPTVQERADFDSRAFMERYGFDASRGGAAHMWREVWDEEVSRIYAQVLKADEPRYGHISYKDAKETLYKEAKPKNKYAGYGDKYVGQGDRRRMPL